MMPKPLKEMPVAELLKELQEDHDFTVGANLPCDGTCLYCELARRLKALDEMLERYWVVYDV